MKKSVLFHIFCLLLCFSAAAKALPIAVKGEAAGHIAVAVNAPEPVQFAAAELQNYLRLITTARYSIQHNTDSRKATVFILGTEKCSVIKPFLKEARVQKLLKKFKYDGYAVCRFDNKVLIIGNNARGVLNGVHRFIYKYTDFIWVRPVKELAVYTVNPDLALNITDYVDNPEFKLRGWGANGRIATRSEEYVMFVSRLCNNWTPGSAEKYLLDRQRDHGLFLEFGGGHNMSSLWLPQKKFGKTNPDFYMMLDGTRRTTGRLNLCYTNKEMIKVFIQNTLNIINTLPDYYDTINIMIDDTQAYCECPACMEAIVLPDGRTLPRSHEAFKSTQFYMFLNQVARAVAKVRPELEVKCFGYFFTAIPPEIPVEKNIRISFCPYVRNDKETLHGKSNQKWLERTREYAKMSPSIIWREYYFSGAAFPRAQANIIAQDLRYINTLGIRMVYPELSWADRPFYAVRAGKAGEEDFFNITGPEFWTINMLYWDPRVDADELRNEYIKRTYREGAAGVQKFYKLLRDSWLNDKTPSRFNTDFRDDMGHYVVNKKLVEPCRAALAEAAETVRDPRSKKLIAQLTATFEKWLKLANSGKVETQEVTKTELRRMPGFDFEGEEWKNAGKLDSLCKLYQARVEPAEPTDVKFMHNNETLYIGFRCPTPGKLRAVKNSPRDTWPTGDRVEIFFANEKDGYYHFAFNCFANGNVGTYDAVKTDPKWNSTWQVKTEIRDGEWRAVVAIPLNSIKLTVVQNNKVRALFCRVRSSQSKYDTDVYSSWGGMIPHNVKGFGELNFSLE